MMMKPFHPFYAFVVCLAAAGHFALAQEKPNLLENAGFETAADVNMPKTYELLLKNGVNLSKGDKGTMPAGIQLNPSEGWGTVGKEAAFEYVSDPVHTGKRSIHVVSPKGFVAVMIGKGIRVEDGAGLTDAINFNKACPFTFYAKGKGAVTANTYMYSEKGPIYDYKESREVSPPIEIADDTQWKKYEGTVKIINPDVVNIVFVLLVQGDLYIDDVTLSPAE